MKYLLEILCIAIPAVCLTIHIMPWTSMGLENDLLTYYASKKKSDTLIYEAESATIKGGLIQKNHKGFIGEGFVDFINSANDYVEWNINVEKTRNVDIFFRYSNGSSIDRQLGLELNGKEALEFYSFPPTKSWEIWSLSPAHKLKLSGGKNRIRLTSKGKSGPNIDQLQITQSGQMREGVEAELTKIKGAIVTDIHKGFSSKGFVDFLQDSNGYLEWVLPASSQGLVEVEIRFANGSSIKRPMQVEVNGVTQFLVDFPSTDSWTTWHVKKIRVGLNSGENKIRLSTIGFNGPNIDYLAWVHMRSTRE